MPGTKIESKFMKSEFVSRFEDESVIRRPRRDNIDVRRYSIVEKEPVIIPELRKEINIIRRNSQLLHLDKTTKSCSDLMSLK